MKILMVLHESPLNPRGGLGVYIAAMTKELVLLGHDVVILGVAYDSAGGIFRVDTSDNVEQHRLLSTWTHKPGSYRLVHMWSRNIHLVEDSPYKTVERNEAFMEAFFRAMPNETFDVVHLHDTYLTPVARVVAEKCRAAMVVSAHMSSAISRLTAGVPNSSEAKWLTEQEMGAYHRADRVVAVSDTYADMVKDHFLLEQRPIPIPNGVNFAELDAIGTYFRPQPKHAAFIGRQSQSKGVIEIYKAARELTDWRFTIISSVQPGSETELPILQVMKDTPQNVRWIPSAGYGPERWAYAASAQVALMPSQHEPFGIAAIEWMALGVPLLTSRIDGLVDFCTDSNSWACGTTAESIVLALRSWSPDDRRVAAAKKTAEFYSWSKAAEKTVRVYEEAIDANRAAA